MNPPDVVAQHLSGAPALEQRVVLPSGTVLYGFATRTDAAVDWWKRLVAVSSQTGLQPIVVSGYEWLVDESELVDRSTEELLADATTIDGGAVLRARGERTLARFPKRAADTVSILAGGGDWPNTAMRYMLEDLRVAVFGGEVWDTSILLIPAAEAWQIPCVLRLAGWNGYPSPAAHAAILRCFAQEYDGRLYDMSRGSASIVVGRPPTDRLAAVKASWEYLNYNDGAFDVYDCGDLLGMAACLLDAEVWHCWWD